MQPELHLAVERLLTKLFPPVGIYSGVRIVVDSSVALAVLQAVESLGEREAACICLRFGLTGSKLCLAGIAQVVPKVRQPDETVKPERTREIIARGLRRLRHPVRSKRIFEAMAKARKELNSPDRERSSRLSG